MGLDMLPPEVIIKILSYVPVLDYYWAKLAGSRYLTDVIRDEMPRLPRGDYLLEMCHEDARRNLQSKPARRAMEIMIERGQSSLVIHFQKRYGRGPLDYHVGRDESKEWVEGRSFRLSLHWAAYYGSENIARLLLDRIHITETKSHRTALHFGAMNNQVAMVHLLLKKGALVNVLDREGKTPLALALESGAGEVAELLQRRGGRKHFRDMIDSRNEEWVMVFQDRQRTWPEINRVAQRYLPVKLINKTGWLRLYLEYQHWKADKTATQIAKHRRSLLLDIRQNRFPSIVPVEGCDLVEWCDINPKTIDTISGFCLDRVPVDMADLEGRTPLHVAAYKGILPTVKHLLSNGAKIEARTTEGNTPLQFAANSIGSPLYVDALAHLVDMGANIEARNQKGRTPLSLACIKSEESSAFVGILLSRGAAVNTRDDDGVSPLHHAVRAWKDSGSCKVLLDHGADINMRDPAGRTALHHSLSYPNSCTKIQLQLVEAGADVNARDNNRTTLLHLAVIYETTVDDDGFSTYGTYRKPAEGISGPCELLLNHGADLEARDIHGTSPLDLVVESNHWRMKEDKRVKRALSKSTKSLRMAIQPR